MANPESASSAQSPEDDESSQDAGSVSETFSDQTLDLPGGLEDQITRATSMSVDSDAADAANGNEIDATQMFSVDALMEDSRSENYATPTPPSAASATVVSAGSGSTDADAKRGADGDSLFPPDLRQFGDFELEGEIARGGMGVVYRARQRSLGRTVALKMILSGRLANATELSRFRAEASAAAGLDHPNIVPIYQVGEHNGQHFFAMGLVEGKSLEEWIRREPMNSMMAAAILRQIAQAIAYAHAQNVVHRDLKPANVLLAESDSSASQSLSPRITDFGLAKRVDRPDDLTGTGNIVGTPSYMAPEQAVGDTAGVGPSIDIYAIGAVGYALLTGQPPFRGASAIDTIRQVIQREPVPPRQINSEIPRDLETILLKCLQKEPARRYETATALSEDLERFIAGDEIRARPITRTERAMRWVKKHRLVTVLGITTALLLLVAGIAGPLLAMNENAAKQTAQVAMQRAEISSKRALAAGRRAEQSAAQATVAAQRATRALADLQIQQQKNLADLYASELPLALTAWQDGKPRRMRDILLTAPHRHRDWEWNYLWNLPDQDHVLLRGHFNNIVNARFTPGGIVSLDSMGNKNTWDRKGGLLHSQKLRTENLRFYDDDSVLAFRSDAFAWTDHRNRVIYEEFETTQNRILDAVPCPALRGFWVVLDPNVDQAARQVVHQLHGEDADKKVYVRLHRQSVGRDQSDVLPRVGAMMERGQPIKLDIAAADFSHALCTDDG
ncbi:MAG: protein kinase, partial [Planctomycetota bacterium]